jgi:hypothetical protein
MKCRIKKVGRDSYFNKHIGIDICPNLWGYRDNARIFDSVAEGRAAIKLYKLKNADVEKIKQ